MIQPWKTGGVLAIGAMLALAILTGNPAHAHRKAPSVQPLSIFGVCSSQSTATASWNVTNTNSFDLQLEWKNASGQRVGYYTIPRGTMTIQTWYNTAQPTRNSMEFYWSNGQARIHASDAQCVEPTPPAPAAPVASPVVSPPQPAVSAPAAPAPQASTANTSPKNCVNGALAANLKTTWPTKNTVIVNTINNAPLCNDVELYLSTYIMPDNYDGNWKVGLHNNPTATPQYLHASTRFVMAQGSSSTAPQTVDMPHACKNVQIDLYYPPEIRVVGPNGHDGVYITGGLRMKSGTCPVEAAPTPKPMPAPVPTPTPPATTPTPVPAPTPTPPSTPAPAAIVPLLPVVATKNPAIVPSELPKTGAADTLQTAILGIALTLGTYAASYIFRMYRQ